MCSNIDRVNTCFRHGTVAAGSFNSYSEKCAACHADTLAAEKHTGRSTGINMESHTGINLRIIKHTCCKHCFCTCKAFFVRLKYKFDTSFKIFFVEFKQFGCTQKHGGMHIVAAGVHEAVMRSEINRRFLFNCKSIHVRT